MKILTKNRGITIIELLLVITIIASLGIASVPITSNFMIRNYFRDSKDALVSQLYTARINSMTNKENSSWGVRTTPNQITTFKGTSFATRDSAFDKSFDTSSSITVSVNEIVFTQYSGDLTNATAFIVSNSLGDSNTISVNYVGNINVN